MGHAFHFEACISAGHTSTLQPKPVFACASPTASTMTEATVHTPHEAARAALIAGDPIVLYGNTDSGPRGVLAFGAEMADTAVTAFAIRYSSGFLAVALLEERCGELGIPPLDYRPHRAERLCVSVDASTGITTGISAADRAATCRILGDSHTTEHDLVRPGHVAVLASSPDLSPSFSSAALKLAQAAGLSPAVAMADLVSGIDATRMANLAESAEFALLHGLPGIRVEVHG